MKAARLGEARAEATVFGAWEKVVGADIAKHSRPIKLDGGVLTVEAESTAWATQLRMLAASLLRSIAAEVGHNVVTKLNIHGPAAPSWDRAPAGSRAAAPATPTADQAALRAGDGRRAAAERRSDRLAAIDRPVSGQ